MKTITITCDHCKTEIEGDHIEIGSENGQEFKYSNTLHKTCGMNTMSKYSDLHFCSKDHFVDFFFGLNYSKKGCEPEQKNDDTCKCDNSYYKKHKKKYYCMKCEKEKIFEK